MLELRVNKICAAASANVQLNGLRWAPTKTEHLKPRPTKPSPEPKTLTDVAVNGPESGKPLDAGNKHGRSLAWVEIVSDRKKAEVVDRIRGIKVGHEIEENSMISNLQQSQILNRDFQDLQRHPPSSNSETSKSFIQPQQVDSPKKGGRKKTKAKRGKNVEDEPVAAGRWLPVEEELLAKCYVAVSEDNNVGRSQKNETFWYRVLNEFNSKIFQKRTKDMLTSKWHTLNANCQKFNAAYKRAKRLGKSGENDVDVLKHAQSIYRDEHKGVAFCQEYSWAILKFHPKWDTPEQVDLTRDVPGVTQEDLFGHDARPRPAGKPRPAKKTKSDATASTDLFVCEHIKSVSAQMVAAAKLPEVIVNGDSPPPKRTVDDVEQTYPPTTAREKSEQKELRENKNRQREKKRAVWYKTDRVIWRVKELREMAYTYYFQLKVNAARHKLTIAVDVNVVEGFEQIIDFLNANPIKYALTVNPTIYTSCVEQFWATTTAKNTNGEAQIHAKVDGNKVIISKATIRGNLKFEDEGELTAYQMKSFLNNFHSWVQAQEELGKDTKISTETQHTHTIIQPKTSQPQRKQKPRKTRRNDTELPQTSVPIEVVADEAVYEEMYDSVKRAATTATGLDAKHDWGIISKTQFTPTLNEPSSIGTSSGSGPRRQKTMEDATAQTRSERVSKFCNDPPLSRVNTLEGREDRLQLKDLMELSIKLSDRVLDLEKTKTAQAKEIANLKKRVKRLEIKKKSRSHRLKRLYKVGLSARVESFNEEESLVIEDISTVGIKETVSTAAPITTADVTPDELTMAQALVEIKKSKPKDYELAARLQEEEQGELTIEEKSRLFVELMDKRKKHFTKLRAEEKRRKPPTKAQKRNQICVYLKNMVGFTHSQLKNKSFNEVQKVFDKTMSWINLFVPMDSEVVKDKAVITQERSSKRS
nr:hypothetical protein [Tanacetum cinerariifolium]